MNWVVAGCPARQRGWVLPAWLAALAGPRRRPDATFVLLNDTTDDSEFFLESAAFRDARGFYNPRFEVYDTHHPGWHRGTRESGWQAGPHERYQADGHANLARVRNRWIERALARWPQATHLWMVDSDVLPETDCLERLLAADKDIVAGAVRNGPSSWNFMMGEKDGEPQRTAGEYASLIRVELPIQLPGKITERCVPVTLLGACTLVRRAVLEHRLALSTDDGEKLRDDPFPTGVRFAPHPRGEDFAFCASAKAAGYGLWLEPRARAAHWMDPAEEPLR